MSDFLAGLSCFISFFLAAAFIGILGWARGRFRNMQQQVDLLKLQVKAAQQAAPLIDAPSVAASGRDGPTARPRHR